MTDRPREVSVTAQPAEHHADHFHMVAARLRALAGAMEKEREAFAMATRTRPDYDIRCPCGAPHWIDTSLPSAIWNQIADPSDTLCMLCIDERLAAKGLTAEAEFYFGGRALNSRMYEASEGDRAELRRLAAQAGRCDCGDVMRQCTSCAVADYQVAHPDCPTCCVQPPALAAPEAGRHDVAKGEA